MSDSELKAALGAFEARRDEMLKEQVAHPYPPLKDSPLWHYADFALAALYRNERAAEANAAILRIQKECPIDENFHWGINLLNRIYFLFNAKSTHFPGRLTPEAEAALADILWRWAQPICKMKLADPERTWWIWGSENHGAMRWSGFWGVAQILSQTPDYLNRRYEDGSTPAQKAEAWNAFYKRFSRERAGKGLLVEIGSSYNNYTLQGWYNMADFATDPVLKKRMEMLLDLFWADWAIEQIDGVRGGGKHRIYPGRAATQGRFSGGQSLSWFYFGLGVPRSQHPSVMCLATSAYRPPLCVADMALDIVGRGTYEYTSRRPGLNLLPKPTEADEHTYVLRPDYGGILRYTYCTPDFVIGTSMVEARPAEEWSAISSQNRWDGVIFAGHPDARIFAQPFKPERGSFYNPHWTIQHKGVLILQKLRTNKHARGQRVWFSAALKRTEEGGWVFAEVPRAYAACRIVRGEAKWEPDDPKQHHEATRKPDEGMWLACADEYSPIIIEVARKCDFADFEAFKSAIKANPLSLQNGVLRYQGLADAGEFTFYTESPQPPLLNGKPINFRPPKVYDSPFIQSDYDSGVVVLQKDQRRVVLDFSVE
jgi:hypothetical protein